MAPAVAAAMEAAEPPEDPKRAFRFCRLFPDLPKFQPDDAGLIALGQALEDPFMPGAGDSVIPGGFTYLGQFVDHDITFDRTDGIPAGSLDPAEIVLGRSPALELDSVYGRGPAKSPELYESDGRRLKIGTTTGRATFGVTQPFPNDLPRNPPEDPETPNSRRAIIGDPRNDENLIVAQTHLAFLKFHNKVVERLQGSGTAAGQLFEEARKTVIQHYQSIVLHDFVPRLTSHHVAADVMKQGRKVYAPKGPEPRNSSLHARRVLGSRLSNGPQHDPQRVSVEPGVQLHWPVREASRTQPVLRLLPGVRQPGWVAAYIAQ